MPHLQHLVSQILARSNDADVAIPRILESLGQILEWPFAAYWEADKSERCMRSLHVWTAEPGQFPSFVAATRHARLAYGEGVPGGAWQLGRATWDTDVLVKPSFPRRRSAESDGLHTAFAFPAMTGERIFGVVELLATEVRPPDQTLLSAAEGAGYQLGLFLHRNLVVAEQRTSEVRRASILETALDCVITADYRGVIVEFNPAAERTFGYRRDEVVGRQMADVIVPPSLREAHLRGIERYLATGEAHVLGRRIEVTGMRSDRSEFPVELAIVRVPVEGPPFFTAYLRDLTERRRLEAEEAHLLAESETARRELERQKSVLQSQAEELELGHEELQALNEELHAANESLAQKTEELEIALRAAEEANNAKTDFLANMSHELRTPLNAIGGYAELLRLGVRGPVTEAQYADLDRIQRSQQHLLRIINDILNFARRRSGELTFQFETFPVEESLATMHDLVRPQIDSAELSYSFVRVGERAMVTADPERFRQILLNLLTNAVKFTGPGGTVTLSWDADDANVYVRVSDTGVGIPAGQLARIFDPFVQLDTGLTRESHGVGLGLSISRDLAHAMDGELSVESEPGRGSTFTLTLPRAASR